LILFVIIGAAFVHPANLAWTSVPDAAACCGVVRRSPDPPKFTCEAQNCVRRRMASRGNKAFRRPDIGIEVAFRHARESSARDGLPGMRDGRRPDVGQHLGDRLVFVRQVQHVLVCAAACRAGI
jgi:hypothetical protein